MFKEEATESRTSFLRLCHPVVFQRNLIGILLLLLLTMIEKNNVIYPRPIYVTHVSDPKSV